MVEVATFDDRTGAEDYLRLSYANSMDRLRKADRRISTWLADV